MIFVNLVYDIYGTIQYRIGDDTGYSCVAKVAFPHATSNIQYVTESEPAANGKPMINVYWEFFPGKKFQLTLYENNSTLLLRYSCVNHMFFTMGKLKARFAPETVLLNLYSLYLIESGTCKNAVSAVIRDYNKRASRYGK